MPKRPEMHYIFVKAYEQRIPFQGKIGRENGRISNGTTFGLYQNTKLPALHDSTIRARHEISVSNYADIRTNCIVPFSVERVGMNIYLCDLLF